MFDIQKLLTRKTVKKFLDKSVEQETLDEAIQVAYHTPTSLNSRPVIMCEITKHKNDEWITAQEAPRTAPHLFCLAFNPEAGEMNARSFLAGRYGSQIGDEKVNETIGRIVANREEWAKQQIYLVAGYFSATLEASGVQGCWIAGFDKTAAAKALALPTGYTPELVFACGYQNPEDPESNETESVRSFEEFYYSEK